MNIKLPIANIRHDHLPAVLDFLPGLLGLERDNVLGDCGRDDGREEEGNSGRVGVPVEPPLLLSRLRTVGIGGLLLRGGSTPGGSCPGGYSGTSNEDSPEGRGEGRIL